MGAVDIIIHSKLDEISWTVDYHYKPASHQESSLCPRKNNNSPRNLTGKSNYKRRIKNEFYAGYSWFQIPVKNLSL
jgi:hypothetical protein